MKFDEIVKALGEFGPYQKRIYFLLCLPAMSCGIQIMLSVFTLGVPKHRCAIPGLHNDTFSPADEYHASIVNASIPWDSSLGESGGMSQCQLRQVMRTNHTEIVTLNDCNSWVYDKSVFLSSIVSKFDLVCEHEMSRAHASMIIMAGLLSGAIGTGILADIVGRKLALMAMIALHAGSSIAVPWAESFIVFIVLRFLTGISISGIFLAVFVLGMELVGPSKRMFVGIVVEVFWAIGVMILGVVAYFVRDWDYLQMSVSFPIILLFTYWWLIPESPRWLLARGRDDDADAIIRRAAKMNGATLPEKIFDGKTFDEVNQSEKLWKIFTSPRFMLRIVILCYNWLVAAMVFYGLSLNAGNLSGNLYVNFELMGIVEIIAYAICLSLLNRIGRKKMHITCMIVGGGSCLSTMFVALYATTSLQWINIILVFIGKCGAAAAFAIIYVYSAELFPTVLRNSLMGVTCLFARMGGMISPYVASLNTVVPGGFGQALPLIVFGGTTVLGGLICFILPETLNKNLPETLDDATNFGRNDTTSRRRQQQDNINFYVDVQLKESQPLTNDVKVLKPVDNITGGTNKKCKEQKSTKT